jgi:enterochelin esterase-like enzyme
VRGQTEQVTSISRRRLLLGGAAGLGLVAATAAGVEEGLLPGRSRVYSGLGLNGDGGTVPTAQSRLVSGSFRSAARNTEVAWTIAYPSAATTTARLPLVVALHGRYEDHAHLFGEHIGLDHFLAVSGLPLAIAAVDGGDSYWHPRRSGEDSAAMVVDEFLPLLGERDLRVDRIGLYGYSMGGYGALRLAGVLGPRRVAAVSAVSPALWKSFRDTAPGAFDDAADFAAQDVMGHQEALRGIPLRLDCGRGDGFQPAVEVYRDGFPHDQAPSGGFQRGGHDDAYWRRMAPAQLAFLGEHLTS